MPADPDFSEQFIFENLMIRHSSDYEALLELTGLTEIRRFTKAEENTSSFCLEQSYLPM